MNNITDIASENQQQWKSINALAAEVKSLSGTVEEVAGVMAEAEVG